MYIRANKIMYAMKYMECMICGRRHPQDAKKCHTCGNGQLRRQYCTSELRVSEYIAQLRRVKLWGHYEPRQSLSVYRLVRRVERDYSDAKHLCAGGRDYPLKTQLASVTVSLRRFRDDCRGFDIRELQHVQSWWLTCKVDAVTVRTTIQSSGHQMIRAGTSMDKIRHCLRHNPI